MKTSGRYIITCHYSRIPNYKLIIFGVSNLEELELRLDEVLEYSPAESIKCIKDWFIESNF
ncbi:hypothetical protein BpHYR1_043542 [Brachionus plicatilis]|uniref:Uncharacterized protein n=1 Tax=Brachionus plicatilis TaxID=10195 RepID=A0A3M7QAZ9_BRAPC|nr:hypothetical protein BpHYR1_043542 [Brachionus plicatilis]